jgi:hypothetical protein
LSRQRLARFVVAVLLLAQLIATLVATLERGWWGVVISLLVVPVVLMIGLSWAIPLAVAIAALGFVGYTLFVLVRWIV